MKTGTGASCPCPWYHPTESAPVWAAVTCGDTTGFDATVDLPFLFSGQLLPQGSLMGNMEKLHRVRNSSSAGS